MNGTDLIKGVGYLDEDILAQALTAENAAGNGETPRQALRVKKERGRIAGRPSWVRLGAAAACLAIAFFAGRGMLHRESQAPMAQNSDSAMYVSNSAKSSMDAELYEGAPMEFAETEAVQAGIAIPAPGTVLYSKALSSAIAANNRDDSLHRVFAQVYADGAQEPLDPAGEDVQALLEALLREQGIEGAADGSGIVLNVTYQQLADFTADDTHGWLLWLCDEGQ